MASLSDEAGREWGIMKGDTISRSALIAEIKKWTTDCACIELIENEPTVDAAPEWISVKDRLPDKAGWYLVFRTKHTHAETAFFKGKTFPLDNHYGTITHWMPLPQPPKMDKGDGEE